VFRNHNTFFYEILKAQFLGHLAHERGYFDATQISLEMWKVRPRRCLSLS
jgi:hypothetical protein